MGTTVQKSLRGDSKIILGEYPKHISLRNVVLRSVFHTWPLRSVILRRVFNMLPLRSVILRCVFDTLPLRNVILRRVFDMSCLKIPCFTKVVLEFFITAPYINSKVCVLRRVFDGQCSQNTLFSTNVRNGRAKQTEKHEAVSILASHHA